MDSLLSFGLGIVGVAVGALIQYGLDELRFRRERQAQKDLDNRRKALLQKALENPPPGKSWRELSTLCRIIGADHQTTTRLLIELGARGSEGDAEVWALIKDKPL